MTNVAVIGAGNWGKNLVRTFYKLGALSAVAESREEVRTKLATDFKNLAIHADYEPVLSSDVPAVAIATPVATHYQVAKEALLAGKDVFVEKPMTMSVAEAEDLVHLAREREKILMVGHLLLYQSAIGWIKDYLASGSLGELRSLHQERLNLGRARSVENALWSLGVHDVAVLLYLVGDSPYAVTAVGHRILQSRIEDDVFLHLRFAGNIRVHLHASWLWPEKRRRLTVVGSHGMLVYDELEQTVVLHRKGINSDLTNRDEGEEVVHRCEEEPLTRELSHFLQCVVERKTPVSDGRSGVEVIRVIERAMQVLKEAD